MNVALFGSGKAKRAYRTFEARVLADGGIIQSPEATLKYYAFLYRTFGYVPRRTYSALTGVKLNNVAVTNLQVYSEDLTQASGWSSEQLSTIVRVVNANTALPFTYWNEIKENTANDRHTLYSEFGLGTNTWIISFYAKQGVGTRYLQLAGAGLVANNEAVVFNLQNGTFKKGLTSTIAKSVYMIPQAEGYRCVAVLQTSTGSGFQLNISNVDDSATDVPSYLGNGSNSIFVSGFQVQALNSHNRATDYIKSEATAGVGTASYVSKMYDMNPISPIDAVQTTPASQPLWDTSPDCSHRIALFDGTNDWLNIPDLGIFNNQESGTYFAIYKDTDLAGGSTSHYLLAATGNTTSFSRASLATKQSDLTSSIISRRLDAGTTTVTKAPANYSGFRSTVGIYNWSANQLNLLVDKASVVSSTLTDGAGLTSATNSASFDIGSLNNGSTNTLFPGVIAEIHADRSIYTQAQINALHDFMKQFYPTLS